MTHAAAPLTTLAIETSNPSAGSGAVCVGVRTPGGAYETMSVESLAPKRRHDDALMPAIDAAVRHAGLTPRDLDCVAVSVGPGGFTGLRVACATAKMVAEATGAACVPVPTALALAAALFDADATASHAVVALASKRETAWVAHISRESPMDAQFESARNGQVCDVNAFSALLHGRVGAVVIADAYLPESLRMASESAGVAITSPRFSAEMCLRVSWELPNVDPIELAPIYPREPEAVSKWRELHG